MRSKNAITNLEGSENELCKRLRVSRASLGFSQTEAGQLIGVSQRTMSNYERGINIPKEDVVKFFESEAAKSPVKTKVVHIRSTTEAAAQALMESKLPPNVLKFLKVIRATAGNDHKIMAEIDAKIGIVLAAVVKAHGKKIAELLLQ